MQERDRFMRSCLATNPNAPTKLEGWPYSFYEIGDGPVKITPMKTATTRVIKFVQAPSLLSRYNGSRPIVVYAPVGWEIRYRIWRADEVFSAAPKG